MPKPPLEDYPSMARWQVQEAGVLAETKLFTLRKRVSQSPTEPSKRGEFIYLESPDWVNVIALTPDDRVVLIEQFRHGLGEVTLEIPGGSIDPGEDAVGAGVRELLEETGYAGESTEIIGAVTPNPAIQNNRCYTLLVQQASQQQEPAPEGLEEIGVLLVPRGDVSSLIREGVIDHALVIAAFHHLDLRERHEA